jgi:hypothetical protein
MPSTIADVDKLFAAGADVVTLTRAEWGAIREVTKGYCASGPELAAPVSAKRHRQQ